MAITPENANRKRKAEEKQNEFESPSKKMKICSNVPQTNSPCSEDQKNKSNKSPLTVEELKVIDLVDKTIKTLAQIFEHTVLPVMKRYNLEPFVIPKQKEATAALGHGVLALSVTEFYVKPIVLLLGPSGGGKTTFLQ